MVESVGLLPQNHSQIMPNDFWTTGITSQNLWLLQSHKKYTHKTSQHPLIFWITPCRSKQSFRHLKWSSTARWCPWWPLVINWFINPSTYRYITYITSFQLGFFGTPNNNNIAKSIPQSIVRTTIFFIIDSAHPSELLFSVCWFIIPINCIWKITIFDGKTQYK